MASCLADRLPSLADWDVKHLRNRHRRRRRGASQQSPLQRAGYAAGSGIVSPTFFREGRQGEVWVPKPILRDMTHFEVHNLMMPLKQTPFDLVVLKNVLIYFDAASKKKVLEQIRRVMRPGSVLVTAPLKASRELIQGLESIQGWLHWMPR